ncbi:MAG: glycosyltransferase family 4 protein, partial [Chitinophagaceae bacterium]|nr:glycosyltransferase family 4 protein [Chitinophagaceae bacterium]
CRFFWNTFYYPYQARKLDILISPTTHGSFILKNQIITIHDLISLRYDNISAHQRFYFKYLLPFLVSRAKLIIAISEATKKDIIELLHCPEEKVKVIYNGFDHSHYNMLNVKTSYITEKYGFKNYLLAVGPTYAHKNFETLLKAYNSFDVSFRDHHPLLIAGGKKAYLGQLKKMVSDLNLDKHVHFLGYVPFELMPSLYREAKALVFPSLHEGFGFPLLEAMACGCPVIVSNTSSMPEVCGDAVVYFDPLNQEALARSIKEVLNNESLQEDLRRKGIIQVQKFSWEQTAKSFKKLIEHHFQSPNLPHYV